MEEKRSIAYGRCSAAFFDAVLSGSYLGALSPEELGEFRRRFADELKSYSAQARTRELDGLEFDANKPEHVARLVKEGWHFMYNEQTSERVQKRVLSGL